MTGSFSFILRKLYRFRVLVRVFTPLSPSHSLLHPEQKTNPLQRCSSRLTPTLMLMGTPAYAPHQHTAFGLLLNEEDLTEYRTLCHRLRPQFTAMPWAPPTVYRIPCHRLRPQFTVYHAIGSAHSLQCHCFKKQLRAYLICAKTLNLCELFAETGTV